MSLNHTLENLLKCEFYIICIPLQFLKIAVFWGDRIEVLFYQRVLETLSKKL